MGHDLVVVFAGTHTEAVFMKGLLEGADIPVQMRDEIIGAVAPWIASAGGAGAVKLAVSPDDADRASEIIAAYFDKEE